MVPGILQFWRRTQGTRRTKILNRARSRALHKVPLLKSSPVGRGEETPSIYAKLSDGRGEERR